MSIQSLSALRVAVAMLLVAGCATGGAMTGLAPDQLSRVENLRVSVSPLPQPGLKLPSTDAGSGAARGAVAGASTALEAGMESGDGYGMILGLIAAPVGLVIGGVAGAVSAEDEQAVELGRRTVEQITADPAIPHAFAARMTGAVRSRGHRVSPASSADPAQGAHMRVAITRFDFDSKGGANPQMRLILSGEARLTADGELIASQPFEYRSVTSRRFTQWTDGDGAVLRAELNQAINAISEQVARAWF
ncbi:MAG: hypothetical protein OEY97_09380 [Nitrospirota bacterium]|nr:hypothetical protein [Nitrospirota bacterium]